MQSNPCTLFDRLLTKEYMYSISLCVHLIHYILDIPPVTFCSALKFPKILTRGYCQLW